MSITIKDCLYHRLPDNTSPMQGDVGRSMWGHSYFWVTVFKCVPGLIYWRKSSD